MLPFARASHFGYLFLTHSHVSVASSFPPFDLSFEPKHIVARVLGSHPSEAFRSAKSKMGSFYVAAAYIWARLFFRWVTFLVVSKGKL